jgi:tetratricopeptide (TPR) repeat protein
MELKKTKVFEMILLLSPNERKKIPDFINSPVFYKGRGKNTLQQLYTLLKESVERCEASQVQGVIFSETEEDIFKALRKGTEDFNYQIFNPLKARLAGIIKKAIIFWNLGCEVVETEIHSNEEIVSKNPSQHYIQIEHTWAILKFYYKRGRLEAFKEYLARFTELCEKKPFDLELRARLYLAHRLAYDMSSKYQEKKVSELHEATSAYLNAFFLLAKIESQDRNPMSLTEDLSFLRDKEPEKLSSSLKELLVLVNQLGKMWETGAEEDYVLYIELLDSAANIIPPEMCKDFYAHARNFCLQQYRQSEKQNAIYGLRIVESYERDLKRGFLYRSDGKIKEGLTQNVFFNMVNSYLRVKRHDDALAFIEANKDRIMAKNETYKDSFYKHCLSQYYFSLGEFDSAISYFTEELEYLPQQFTARMLEMKIHYEHLRKTGGSYDYLISRLSAFRTFRKRKLSKITQSDRVGTGLFCKYISILINDNPEYNDRKMDLYSILQNEPNVAEREWFLKMTKKSIGIGDKE